MVSKGDNPPQTPEIDAQELAATIRYIKQEIQQLEPAVIEAMAAFAENQAGMEVMAAGIESSKDPEAHKQFAGGMLAALFNAQSASMLADQIELECLKNNLELLESEEPREDLMPRYAEQEPMYVQAQRMSALSMLEFFTLVFLPGIATILSTINRQPYFGIDADKDVPEDAEALRALMKQDPKAMLLINRLAEEFSVIGPLLNWADQNYRRGLELPLQAKLAHFSDPDWSKVVGKVQLFSDLPTQVKAYPLLVEYFTPPDFEQAADALAAASKVPSAAREALPLPTTLPRMPALLSQAGGAPAGTGPLAANAAKNATGPLSGQPPRGQQPPRR